jgi:hypothetical protein
MNLSVQQVKEQDTEKERTRKINDTAINLDNRIKALKLKVDELEELYNDIESAGVSSSNTIALGVNGINNVLTKYSNISPSGLIESMLTETLTGIDIPTTMSFGLGDAGHGRIVFIRNV